MKRFIAAFGLAILLSLPAYSQNKVILCLRSGNMGPYNDAVNGFKKELNAKNVEYQFLDFGADYRHDPDNIRPDIVLAVGSKALEIAVQQFKGSNIVFMMVVNPKSQLSSVKGITLDIPPERAFKTLKRILPQTRKIAVMYNPLQTKDLVAESISRAESAGIEMIPVKVKGSEDVYGAVRSIIGKVDALWMIPDSSIYNSDTSQDVLLVSLREKLPVIGLSPMYVKAGALFALSCDYADIGSQAADLAINILNNTIPSNFSFAPPRKDVISVNLITAERIGVKIPDSLLKEAANVYK